MSIEEQFTRYGQQGQNQVKEIAWLTYEKQPVITQDDAFVTDLLEQQGIKVTPIPWTTPHVNWARFDQVIFRSCWDYHQKSEQFLHFLTDLERASVSVQNPVSLIRWNLNKNYLADLEKKGVRIPETVFVPQNSPVNLKNILQEKGWEKAVVKPAISASAYKTFLVNLASAENISAEVEELRLHSDILIQKFIPEVSTTGEYSMMFFGKKFSHAVLKKPPSNEFRVQAEFGGFVSPVVPKPKILEEAKAILELLDEEVLYARVDGIEVDGYFVLMELELIEPTLFLKYAPEAPQNFALVIMQQLLVASLSAKE